MGHNINAVIGHAALVARIASAAGCPAPTDLAFGLAIVPLGHAQIDRLTGTNLGEVGDGFKYLSPTLEGGLAAAAEDGVFAYIETEYFGGTGSQAAAVFSGSLPPVRLTEPMSRGPVRRDSPINSALRSLGVKAAPGQDEFDTLGLGQFRSLEALGLDEYGDD